MKVREMIGTRARMMLKMKVTTDGEQHQKCARGEDGDEHVRTKG